MHKYQKMIYKLAWNAWRSSQRDGANIDIADFVSEGQLAYYTAKTTWDPNLGSFSTHLWWEIQKHLLRLKRQGRPIPTTEIDDDDEGGPNPERAASFSSALSNLSAEATEIVRVVLFSPGELYDFTAGRAKTTLSSIRKHFGRKWRREIVESAIKEIKTALRSI